MNTTTLPLHSYRATFSNAGTRNIRGLESQLAAFPRYNNAWLLPCRECSPCGDKGSVSMTFVMNHIDANALRKWLWRRWGGRVKFARQVASEIFLSRSDFEDAMSK
jgi:hypothetical protein